MKWGYLPSHGKMLEHPEKPLPRREGRREGGTRNTSSAYSARLPPASHGRAGQPKRIPVGAPILVGYPGHS